MHQLAHRRRWNVARIAVLAAVWGAAARPLPAAPDAEVLAAERARIETIRRASAAAVAIFAGEAGGGSGVLVSPDGYAVTNFHVVQTAGPALRCGLADGRLVDAVIVGIDPTGDLAVVKLLGDGFPWAELADSDGVAVGDWCFAAGNPFLLATDLRPSISAGIVSGVHRYQFPAGTILEYTDCLQVDAAINPGNSGGGLFDADGRIIGVNGRASFEKRGRVNVGAGYAISSNQVRHFLGCLKAGRLCDHASLGATVASGADGRVVVSDILESSEAWRRGLRCDDEIVALAGRPVRTVNAFKNVLGTLPAGWQVPLAYRRDGRRQQMLVRLAGVHAAAELAALVAGDRGPGTPRPDGQRRGRLPADGDDPPGDDGGGHVRPAEIPAAVRAVYEARRGFVNHHFNVVERDRVATAIARRRAGFGAGAWELRGGLAAGGPFRITLADDEASIELPTGESSIFAADDLDRSPQPPGSGGLLAALVLWRRLVIEGPGAVGRTIYWGTAPRDPLALGEHAPPELVDVLETAVAGVEARFLVDDGVVVGIDLWTEPAAEPCEVRFSPGADGRPTRMAVSRGGVPFGDFQFEPQAPGDEP